MVNSFYKKSSRFTIFIFLACLMLEANETNVENGFSVLTVIIKYFQFGLLHFKFVSLIMVTVLGYVNHVAQSSARYILSVL